MITIALGVVLGLVAFEFLPLILALMFFALIAGLFLGLIALAIAFPGLAGFLFSLYIIWIIIDENSKKGKITN